jgi:hypothetical protein
MVGMGIAAIRSPIRSVAMADSKDSKRAPTTDRQASKRQARASVDAARDTRKSHRPGVDDDSEVVESLVGTLAAPVEGVLDPVREREQDAERGRDLGPGEVGGVSGQRASDVPHSGEVGRGKVPTKPEDAEADPLDIAEDMTRDRPGARARR